MHRNIPDILTNCAILLVLVGFFALGVHDSARLAIWYDEGITLLQLAGHAVYNWPNDVVAAGEYAAVMRGTTELGYIGPMLVATDIHPPLYYLLAEAWVHVFGNSAFTVRLLSVAAIAGTSLLTLAMAWRAGPAARLATCFAIISTVCFTVAGVSARNYALGMLLVTASIFMCQRLIQGCEPRKARVSILLAYVFAAGAFMTHYFTILATGPALLFAMPAMWRARKIAVVNGVLIGLSSVAVMWPFLRVQLFSRPGQYGDFTNLFDELAALVGAYVNVFEAWPTRDLPGEVAHLVMIAALIMVAGIALWRSIGDRRLRFHLSVSASFGLLYLMMFFVTDKSLTMSAGSRYLNFVAPSMAIIVGMVVSTLWSGPRVAKVLALAMAIVPLWAAGTRIATPDYRGPAWGEERRYSAIEDMLARHPVERTIGVVVGHGWGATSSVAYNLPSDMPMIISRDVEKMRAQLGDLSQFDALVVGGTSWSPEYAFQLELEEHLEALGFERVEKIAWERRRAPDGAEARVGED